MEPNEQIRLSISEAAKLFGVNAQTIRRAIKRGEILYIVVQNRYKIGFESLVEWSQKNKIIFNKMETRGIGQFVGQWKIRNKIYTPLNEPNRSAPHPIPKPPHEPIQGDLLAPPIIQPHSIPTIPKKSSKTSNHPTLPF